METSTRRTKTPAFYLNGESVETKYGVCYLLDDEEIQPHWSAIMNWLPTTYLLKDGKAIARIINAAPNLGDLFKINGVVFNVKDDGIFASNPDALVFN